MKSDKLIIDGLTARNLEMHIDTNEMVNMLTIMKKQNAELREDNFHLNNKVALLEEASISNA